MQAFRTFFAALTLSWSAISTSAGAAEPKERELALDVEHDQSLGELRILHGGLPVATYAYRDRDIHRPFFANVHAPGGIPITRRHPPRLNTDPIDHATMHPGIWLAFGDIGGHDFWRNKDRVEHVEFAQRPASKLDRQNGVVTFAVKNRYMAGGKLVCQEFARHAVHATPHGYLFTFDSEFSADQPFTFGDQEEMGLGIRLAAPIVVKGGAGTITSSSGTTNERDVWGRQADWCDYSGVLKMADPPGGERANPDGKPRAGLLLVTHPKNFRRSWMHARDYGVLVANPFGQRAFTKGNESRVEVKPGETLRLRFGVWAYSGSKGGTATLTALADDYIRLSEIP